MSYKNIERSREARLWISQVIIPVGGIALVTFANPNVRQLAKEKARTFGNWFKGLTRR